MTEKREEKVKQSGSRTPLPSFRSLLLSPRPFLLFLVFALLQLGGLTSCTLVPNQIDFDLDGKHARRDAEESPEDDEAQFDVEGIEASGRIPKAKMPPGLKNPDRWRYIPEGRIVEGNFLERFLVTSFIAPIFFFERDIGAGGGVGVTDFDFRQQRRQEWAGIFGSYTTEGQQRYAVAWKRWIDHEDLPDGGVIQEERSFYDGALSYSRTLSRRFFGLGDNTRESSETDYTDQALRFGGTIHKSFPDPGSDPVFSLGFRFENHHLSRGGLDSKPNTKDVFVELFEEADTHDSFWLSGSLRYDTRDSQHNPYEGFSIGIAADSAPAQTHGDVGAVFSAFATGVIEVPGLFHDGGDADEENPPTDTVGAAVFVRDTVGNLPFFALPSLGGSNTLRGFIENRWTGESAWHAALEYRFWMLPRGIRFTDHIRIERVGLAPFVEVGTVDDELDEVFRASIKSSYGVGFRLSFERTVLLRADLGFSEDGLNFTFGFGLTF